jgi:hypothetical protein
MREVDDSKLIRDVKQTSSVVADEHNILEEWHGAETSIQVARLSPIPIRTPWRYNAVV